MYVPFTGLGLHGGYRGDTWLENRIRVFKQFVIPSLLFQTNKDFTLWISWRKEDAYNPIVEDLVKWLSHTPLDVIHTYCGVMFWDDKYNDSEASGRLMETFKNTLPKLETYCMNDSHILMTIQPSDDMYMPNVVEETQIFFRRELRMSEQKSYPHPMYNVFGYEKGYMINYATKEIAEYNPDTTPPFYTICFPREVFLDPTAHYQFTGPYHSHEYVGDFLAELRSPYRAFVVGTHGENISTVWNHPYKGKVLSESEKNDILVETGTYYSDPVIVRRNGRLVARMVLNALPFQNIIRSSYYKLPKWIQLF
jgi:hypothetical protein